MIHIDPAIVEQLRAAGYVVVPLTPTAAMIEAGAPICFQAYRGSAEESRDDARECWQAMIAAAPPIAEAGREEPLSPAQEAARIGAVTLVRDDATEMARRNRLDELAWQRRLHMTNKACLILFMIAMGALVVVVSITLP